MAYETLIAALLEEGEAKCKGILRKARAEGERLIAEAAAAAKTVEREADQGVRHDLAGQRVEALSRAALSRRQMLLQAKHEVLDAVWRRVTEIALALPGPERARIARGLLDELLRAAPPGPLTVIIDPRERASLAPSLEAQNLAFEEQQRDDLVLGAEVVGGGEILRTSVATRLTKAKPELLIELNRLLFREQQAMGDRREAIGK